MSLSLLSLTIVLIRYFFQISHFSPTCSEDLLVMHENLLVAHENHYSLLSGKGLVLVFKRPRYKSLVLTFVTLEEVKTNI